MHPLSNITISPPDRQPIISVLMSVHNGQKYVATAIESILSQSFDNFDFIIINDGSTDKTASIINEYSISDTRIRVITQNQKGLTKSLNIGTQLAKGEFIARLDADDSSLPDRFANQIKFLNNNQRIAAVGTWVKIIDSNGNSIGEWRPPTSTSQIQWHLIFGSVIAHPSVMIRKSAIEEVGGYNDHYTAAQDYDLWSRLIQSGKQLANIPDKLTVYRKHASQISSTLKNAQTNSSIQISQNYIEFFVGKSFIAENLARLATKNLSDTRFKYALATCYLIKRVLKEISNRLGNRELEMASIVFRKRLFHASRTLPTANPLPKGIYILYGLKLLFSEKLSRTRQNLSL